MKEFTNYALTFDRDGALRLLPLDDYGKRTGQCIRIKDGDFAITMGVALIRASREMDFKLHELQNAQQ
jgi:hypothetical protein